MAAGLWSVALLLSCGLLLWRRVIAPLLRYCNEPLKFVSIPSARPARSSSFSLPLPGRSWFRLCDVADLAGLECSAELCGARYTATRAADGSITVRRGTLVVPSMELHGMVRPRSAPAWPACLHSNSALSSSGCAQLLVWISADNVPEWQPPTDSVDFAKGFRCDGSTEHIVYCNAQEIPEVERQPATPRHAAPHRHRLAFHSHMHTFYPLSHRGAHLSPLVVDSVFAASSCVRVRRTAPTLRT
jgi:hypothetical protein